METQNQDSISEAEILGDDDLKYESIEVADNPSDAEEEEIEEEDDGEEEFSFMCGDAILSPTAAEDLFINGQLRTILPLLNSEDSDDLRPPVDKIFVETGDGYGEVTSAAPVENSPETCRKSNSTGFSKIWRFKDLLGRSNSDGRDTFVFLNNGESTAETAPVKDVATVKVKKTRATKTSSLSPHEVYLRSKAKAEVRRRSYLPYRPELMGFFTNVNGGLSKNVHPY